MDAFRYDGPLMKILTKIANLMIVSFFWCVCCIPIVTVVPACSALFRTTVQTVRGSGTGVIADFFRFFKENLKQGCLFSILIAASGYVLYVCISFGLQNIATALGLAYFCISLVLFAIWALTALCIAPVLSKIEASFITVLRLSAYIAVKRLLANLFIFVLLIITALFIDFYPVLLLLLPGVFVDLICAGTENALIKFLTLLGFVQDEKAQIEEPKMLDAEISALKQAEMLQE